MKYSVVFEAWELERFFQDQLRKKTETCASAGAGAFGDNGEIVALEDAIGLLKPGILTLERFMEVRKTRIEFKTPTYSKAQDKANGDSWWITGYNTVIRRLFPEADIPDETVEGE